MPALLVRRPRWTLTWSGRLILLGCAVMLAIVLGRDLCAFLAVSSPVGGQFLVVEGWMPAYAYREAASVFVEGHYQTIVAATIDEDEWESTCGIREHFGKRILVEFGVPEHSIAMPSADRVERDRTLHGAMAVKRWLESQGIRSTSIDLVSLGPHARRSHLLYEKALGDDFKVGVIAIADRRFDAKQWWRSSAGVRTVVGEMLAYLYARLSVSMP